MQLHYTANFYCSNLVFFEIAQKESQSLNFATKWLRSILLINEKCCSNCCAVLTMHLDREIIHLSNVPKLLTTLAEFLKYT